MGRQEKLRRFDQDFRDGVVRIVEETGKPIALVARDLGIKEGILGNWVKLARRRRAAGTERWTPTSGPIVLREPLTIPMVP
ncbi:transposase [Nonomuraea sp. NBC_00507]|uniref:transposase n=1 Tax=Nonomuraea sp. NBC_00507 TaxID=2976002 RepID=UPI002E1752D7